MIDSTLLSKSSLEQLEDVLIDNIDAQTMINKSTLYHLILSFVHLIHQDPSTLRIEKSQIMADFGFNLGKNITEEESLGNMKYFILKNDKDKGKPFIGQFKFLAKVWTTVFGSTSKLFTISIQGQNSAGYKLEDRDFGLTKWLSGNQQQVRLLRKLLLQLTKGVLQGFLCRFELVGEVSYSEVGDNHINFELKNLSKKAKTAFK